MNLSSALWLVFISTRYNILNIIKIKLSKHWHVSFSLSFIFHIRMLMLVCGRSQSAVVSTSQKWFKEGQPVNRREDHGCPRVNDVCGKQFGCKYLCVCVCLSGKPLIPQEYLRCIVFDRFYSSFIKTTCWLRSLKLLYYKVILSQIFCCSRAFPKTTNIWLLLTHLTNLGYSTWTATNGYNPIPLQITIDRQYTN